MAKIIITRARAFVDVARAYAIFVHGFTVAKIRDGETRLIEVAEGEHVVQCRVDWNASQKLKIIAADLCINLFCKPTGRIWFFDSERHILLVEGDENQNTPGDMVTQVELEPTPAPVPHTIALLLTIALLALAGRTTRDVLEGHIDASTCITVALAVGVVSLGLYLNWRSQKLRR